MKAFTYPPMAALTLLLEARILSKIAFIGFLLSLPLSVRKVFFVFSPDGSGVFNEYTDISLYLSDLTLFVFLTILILENKNVILSILCLKKMFHVEQLQNTKHEDLFVIKNVPRGTFEAIFDFIKKKCSTWNILKIAVISPLPFLFWSAVSIFWSQNEILAFYASSRLFYWYFFYIGLILFIVPRGTIRVSGDNCSTWNNSKSIEFNQNKLFHVEQLQNTQLSKASMKKNVPRGTFQKIWSEIVFKCSTWNIWQVIFLMMIFNGFIQGFLAIIQFSLQSSMGLIFLKESLLSASQPGIAKIIFGDHVFIRPYGLFPHPNVLSGFLGISLLFTITYPLLFYTKMFHVEHLSSNSYNVPRGTFQKIWNWLKKKCSTWNISKLIQINHGKMFHVEHSLFVYRTVLFVQLIGFLLTFSKAAYFGLVLAVFYYIFQLFHVEQLKSAQFEGMNIKENVPRGTFLKIRNWLDEKCSTWNISELTVPNKLKMFHVEHFWYYFCLIFVFLVGVTFSKSVNWHYFLIQPITERMFVNHEFVSVISQYPLSGIGIGQSVFLMQDFFLEKLLAWQFQPIHSLYLLVIVETGLIGFSFVVMSLWFVLKKLFSSNVPRGTWQERLLVITLSASIIFVGIISLFDHYFWDIQQGQLLLWLLLGLSVSARLQRN